MLVAPSPAGASSSAVLTNIKPVIAHLLAQTRTTTPHFLMYAQQQQQQLADRSEMGTTWLPRRSRQYACHVVLGCLQELRLRQDDLGEPLDDLQNALTNKTSSSSLPEGGMVVPTLHFVLFALLCVAPNAKGFHSLLGLNAASVGLDVKDVGNRVRLGSCLLSCYDMRPQGRTAEEYFPSFVQSSQKTAFARSFVKVLLRPKVAPSDSGIGKDEEVAISLQECVDYCCSPCWQGTMLVPEESSTEHRDNGVGGGDAMVANDKQFITDFSSVLHTLIWSLLVLDDKDSAKTMTQRCFGRGGCLPLPLLVCCFERFDRDGQRLVVDMFVNMFRKAPPHDFLRAGCCVSLSLLLAALSGSMRQSAADGVLENKDAISMSKIFRSIDLAFLLQPAVSGERAVFDVVTWSSNCSLLIELLQGFIPANTSSPELRDMRSAAVELCVRVAQCWSPPPKKSQPEKGLRLASLSKEPPVQRPLLPNVSSAGQVPHAALAALVAHLLAVGELYAAATCVHSLHVGGNIDLSHYNVALLSGVAAAAKITNVPYAGILGLIKQRKQVFGPDVLEPLLLAREESSEGREGQAFYDHVRMAGVFSSWRSFGECLTVSS